MHKGIRQTAYFDLDRTVFSINSGYRWLLYERQRGHLNIRQLASGFVALGRYAIGQAELDRVLLDAIADYQGEAAKDLEGRTLDFYQSVVKESIRTDARAAIAHHKRLGHRCVILTTSSQFLAKLVAVELNFDGYLCTTLETMNGVLTGRPSGRLCYGPGKRFYMEADLSSCRQDGRNAYFYTDSFSDLPALKVVGYPRIVTPDRRLRKWASEKGWPILDWT